jgi:hypothetical protein
MSTNLMKAGKKENNRKSGAAAIRKEKKREEAKKRQAAYSQLTMTQKLERGVERSMGQKERAKLILRAKKEGLTLSSELREKLNL